MLRKLLSFFKVTREPSDEGSSLFSKNGDVMWLFVGLGNPGSQYEKNRHNVGFMAIEAIADGFPAFSAFRKKFQGYVSEGRIEGQKIILLKPETYMNNSGQSVIECAKFYKIEPDHVIVFHDELDIAPSEVRTKKGGSNAGHNGLKSIQAHLGTSDFWRVRIGIGRPAHKGAVSNYVLDNFSKAEQEWLAPLVEYLGDQADVIVKDSPKEYEKTIKECMKI